MALPSSAKTETHLSHFQSLPWCAALIASPTYIVTPCLWRNPKASTEDELLAVSLNSPTTISHHLALYRVPQSSPFRSSFSTTATPLSPLPQSSSASSSAVADGVADGVREMKLLVTLGAGLNGWPGICHGGAIATLIDEFMGALMNVHRKERVAAGHADSGLGNTLTAKLEVEYKAPVTTPGTYVITVEFEKIEGRKLWVVGRIEDQAGKVGVKARALFIASRTDLSKARI